MSWNSSGKSRGTKKTTVSKLVWGLEGQSSISSVEKKMALRIKYKFACYNMPLGEIFNSCDCVCHTAQRSHIWGKLLLKICFVQVS